MCVCMWVQERERTSPQFPGGKLSKEESSAPRALWAKQGALAHCCPAESPPATWPRSLLSGFAARIKPQLLRTAWVSVNCGPFLSWLTALISPQMLGIWCEHPVCPHCIFGVFRIFFVEEKLFYTQFLSCHTPWAHHSLWNASSPPLHPSFQLHRKECFSLLIYLSSLQSLSRIGWSIYSTAYKHLQSGTKHLGATQTTFCSS